LLSEGVESPVYPCGRVAPGTADYLRDLFEAEALEEPQDKDLLVGTGYLAQELGDRDVRLHRLIVAINGRAPVSGGMVYAGGYFTSIGGQPRNRLAAIDSTGTATAWNPGVGGTVEALAVDGGTVYAGGNFTQVGGQPRNRIAAIDAAGSVTSWDPNANSIVYELAVSGGMVYAVGFFTNVGGQPRNHIAAIDAAGNATAWDPNANGPVYALAVSGGTVYAGGNFTTIGGQPRNSIAALDVGTGDATVWDPGADDSVYAVAVSGGTVYAGGPFKTVGGERRNYIAAINAAGNVTAWDPCANGSVATLAAESGTIYAGGHFSGICGEQRRNIAAIDATGSPTSWAPHANDEVHTIAVEGGTIYVGGMFTTIGGSEKHSIAAIDASGNATAWDPNANGPVYALAVSGGTVYAGGNFTTIGGQPRNSIAALDVGTGDATVWDPGADDEVHTLAVEGGTVYAGGDFTHIDGQPRSHIAAIDAAGNVSVWGPNADDSVEALAVDGTTVYAGGEFTAIGGEARNRIAAIDSTGSATSWNPDAQNTVHTLAVDGTTVYAGGDFAGIGGEPRSWVAAIDETGSAMSWNPYLNGRVTAIAVGGGTVSVGGHYGFAGSQYRHHFTQFKSPAPAITEISPTAGTVGTEVTIEGSEFGVARESSHVSFGSTRATEYNSWGDNEIKCKVPSRISGKVGVTVTTVGGTSNTRQFSVIPETITMNPKTGSMGTEVVLTGSAFGGVRGASHVSFGSTRATEYISWGDAGIKCKVPPIASGDYDVNVTTSGGTSNSRRFTVNITRPSITWYLAEGYTGDGNYPGEAFDTYVLIQNPSDKDALIKATYMLPGGDTVEEEYTVLSHERFTVHIDDIQGLHNTSVSTYVEAVNDVPVICERAMYFNYYGKQGGHDSVGVNSPNDTWYLAEGYTGDGNYPGEAFDTYVLIQNPSDRDTSVIVSFMFPDRGVINRTYELKAFERFTVHVDEIPGCGNASVSTGIQSVNGVPVICERAMYFNYYGAVGGHDSRGYTR